MFNCTVREMPLPPCDYSPPTGHSDRLLRIGVLLRKESLPAWQHEVIATIAKLEFLGKLFLLRGNDRSIDSTGAPSRHFPALIRAWRGLDRRLFRTALACLEPVDASRTNRLGELIELESPLRKVAYTASDLSRIQAAELDVIIDLEHDTHWELTNCAKYGVWWLRHAGAAATDSDQGMFELMCFGEPVFESAVISGTPICLQPICRSFSTVDPHSLQRMQALAYSQAGELLQQALRRLSRGITADPDIALSEKPQKHAVTNMVAGKFVVRWAASAVRDRLRNRLYRENWCIGVRSRGMKQPFTLFLPPSEGFYADPFVIEKANRAFLFFEYYSLSAGRGAIAAAELDGSGRCSKPEVVLARDYHLSYPFLFEWEGHIYLIPESHQNGTIDVYTCVEFPHRWDLRHTLMRGVSAVDPTIIQYGGKLWLFAAGFGGRNSHNRDLHLFCSDTLFGPWRPHRKNPIVSDVRCARPAGRPFVSQGMLIRPGQDCSNGYGSAVALNHITVFSEDEYREVPCGRLGPDYLQSSCGVHTFNRSGRFEVVDGRTTVRREIHL